MEVKTLQKKVETIGIQSQKTINSQTEQLEEMKGQMQQEQEKRVLYESEFKSKDKMVQALKNEIKNFED